MMLLLLRRCLLLHVVSFFTLISAEDLYCGEDNCYDILGILQDASDSDIRKAYRKLAIKLHPDKNREIDKAVATEQFQQLAKAYEVLSSTQLREAYDYYLAHPNERLYNQYRFYQAQYQPKVLASFYSSSVPHQLPISYLLIGLLLFLTIIQYINAWILYNRHYRIATTSTQFLAKLAAEKECRQQYGDDQEETIKRELLSTVVIDGHIILQPSILDTLPLWPVRTIWSLWSTRHERRRLKQIEEETRAAEEEMAKAEEEQVRQRTEERLRLRKAGKERKKREQQKLIEAKERHARVEAEMKRQEETRRAAEREAYLIAREKLTEKVAGAIKGYKQVIDGMSREEIIKCSEIEDITTLTQLIHDIMKRNENTPETAAEAAEWTEDELGKLTKAMSKYPGGTRNRWVKVRDYIGSKTEKQVIAKSTELKSFHRRVYLFII